MTSADFDTLFERTMASAWTRLDPLRTRAVQARYTAVGATIAVPVTIVAALLAVSRLTIAQAGMARAPYWAIGTVVVAAMLGLRTVATRWQRSADARLEYADAYKREIVGVLIGAFDSAWTYEPDRGFPYKDYETSDVAVTPFDEYDSEDTIQGVRDGRAFVCVEIHTRAWRGRGRDRALVTLFRGLFIRVALGLHNDSRTLVVADTPNRTFGGLVARLVDRWKLTREPVVHLENPAFERAFNVYSSDPVAAHLLLSPAMMERLTRLRAGTGRMVSLALNQGVATAAIGFDRDLFEPSLDRGAARRDAGALFDVLSLIAVLIDSMPMPRVDAPLMTSAHR